MISVLSAPMISYHLSSSAASTADHQPLLSVSKTSKIIYNSNKETHCSREILNFESILLQPFRWKKVPIRVHHYNVVIICDCNHTGWHWSLCLFNFEIPWWWPSSFGRNCLEVLISFYIFLYIFISHRTLFSIYIVTISEF